MTENFCNLKRVVLPTNFHLSSEIFNRTEYFEKDLDSLEEIHNCKIIEFKTL